MVRGAASAVSTDCLVTALKVTRSTGKPLLQRPLFLQNPQDMPGNRLALTIRVSGEDQLVRLFHGGGDLLHHLAGLAVDVPVHLEVFVGFDGAVLGGQIAHVSIGGDTR